MLLLARLLILVTAVCLCGNAWSDNSPIFQLNTGGHTAKVTALAFTHDGKFLFSGSHDKTIRVWDVKRKKINRIIRSQIGEAHNGKIYTLAISPNDKFLAAGGYIKSKSKDHKGHVLRIYDLTDNDKVIALLDGHSDAISSASFSADGKKVATVSKTSEKGQLNIWRVPEQGGDGKFKKMLHIEINDMPYTVRFSHDSRQIVIVGKAKKVTIYNLNGKVVHETKPLKNILRSVAVHPVSGEIVSGDIEGNIQLWDETAKHIKNIKKVEGVISSIGFTRDGKEMLVTSAEHGSKSYIFSVPSYKNTFTYNDHDSSIMAAAISQNSALMATAGGFNNEIHIRKSNIRKLQSRITSSGISLNRLAFSHDGHQLIWEGEYANRKKYYRIALPKVNEVLKVPIEIDGFFENPIHQGFSKKTNKYKVTSEKLMGRLAVLKIFKDENLIGRISRNNTDGIFHSVYGIVDHDESIISGGANGTLNRYSRKGDILVKYEGHSGDIFSVSISPDGSLLASTSSDQSIKLWNYDTGQLIVSLFIDSDLEWVIWSPKGYFSSSPKGGHLIGWHINKGEIEKPEYMNASQLYKHFLKPFLISKSILNRTVEDYDSKGVLLDFLKSGSPDFHIVYPRNNSIIESEKDRIQLVLRHNKKDIKVKSIKIIINGSQIDKIKGLEKKTKNSIFPIPSIHGENRLKVIVTSNDGISKERNIVFLNKKKSVEDTKGDLYIVSIGVSNYYNMPSNRQLYYAHNDANKFYKLMVEQNKLYNHVHGIILSSGRINPSKKNIERAVNIFRKAKHNDTIILFISGHGVLDGKEGNYYFASSDAVYKDGPILNNGYVLWSVFQKSLENANGTKIMFVDTCHGANAYNRNLLDRLASQEIRVFSSTDGETLAIERESLKHGIFSHSLIEGMKGKADSYPKDGSITFNEVIDYTYREVDNLSKGSQRPYVIHIGYSNDIILAK